MTWVNFQNVRNELDFETVLTHYGFEVKANGKHQVKVHCPFHDDGNPSCGINLTKKVFHCFSCHAKGNILDFYTKMEGMDPAKTQDLRKAALLAVEVFDVDGGSQEAKTGDQPKAKQNAVRSQKRPSKQVENCEPSEGRKKLFQLIQSNLWRMRVRLNQPILHLHLNFNLMLLTLTLVIVRSRMSLLRNLVLAMPSVVR